MNNSKVISGIHKELESSCLDNDTVTLMKTQDHGYLIHKVSVDLRKIEKLKENLHIIGDKTKTRQHKTFVDTKEELKSFDVVKHFETAPEFVNRAFNRPRIKTLLTKGIISSTSTTRPGTTPTTTTTASDIKQIKNLTEQSYEEFNRRVKRVNKLKKVVQTLELQRNLMGKGTKRKVSEGGEGKPPVFKWKKQRQR